MFEDDTEYRNMLNVLHRDHPEEGDYWNEMFMPVCTILKVMEDGVLLCRKTKTLDKKYRTWDLEKSEYMSKAAFAKWVTYQTIPNKTWCDVTPKRKYPRVEIHNWSA